MTGGFFRMQTNMLNTTFYELIIRYVIATGHLFTCGSS